MTTEAAEMPKYKCHKEVHALKIRHVQALEADDAFNLLFSDAGYPPIRVTGKWVAQYNPEPGGYYVVYKDGYEAYSPAEAFEDGYTLVP